MPLRPFTKKQRVEHPDRLRRFLDDLNSIDWHEKPEKKLDTIFNAINELAFHEILFYYHARKKQRVFSIITRGLAVTLGSLGVLFPLIAGTNPGALQYLSIYGYPFLAGAGIFLIVNRLFGATGGHIRYVTAQLELERALTIFRLDWARWQSASRSTPDVTDDDLNSAFEILSTFTLSFYKTIQEETNVWGKSVSEALAEYANRVSVTPTKDTSI